MGGAVIKIDYRIILEDGDIFDSSDIWGAPFELEEGESPFPGKVMDQIEKLQPGESASVPLMTPEEGYGRRDEELVFTLSQKKLPENFEPEIGAMFSFMLDDDEELFVTVIAMADDEVTLDANHPLAGVPVTFECTLLTE